MDLGAFSSKEGKSDCEAEEGARVRLLYTQRLEVRKCSFRMVVELFGRDGLNSTGSSRAGGVTKLSSMA